MLLIHYTGMATAAEALVRLTDPQARVSAHYLIDEGGSVLRLVDERERAWHAGVSWWAGRAGLNDVSIGIELVNPGHAWGYRPFPAPQIDSLEKLGRAICERWAIDPVRVLGHSDVAPARKDDPGELFPWRRLASAGLGLWPSPSDPRPPDASAARALLGRIGYGPGTVPLPTLVRAFQRRYRPSQVDGWLDPQTMGLMVAVAALCPVGGTAT